MFSKFPIYSISGFLPKTSTSCFVFLSTTPPTNLANSGPYIAIYESNSSPS